MKTNKFFLLIIIAIVIFAMEIFAQTPPKPQVTGWEKYYTVQPDIANCNSGTIKDSVRQQFLDYINLVRRIHNLGELAYDYNQNDVVAKAALMSVANGSLNTPAPGWECYDANAAATDPKNGIYMMNINDASYDATPEDALRFLLFSENVTYQGQYVLLYRRAILNPFLHYISYGRCDGKPKVQYQYQNVCTQILQFLLNDNDATDFAGDFVAYPFQDYPTDLFDKAFYLSFFVVHDKTGWRNNGGVDYSATTIEVKDELNNTMTVTNKESDNLAFTQGNLHNSLRWKVTGLATTTRYNVTIRNVKINGNARDYTYWFDLNNRNLPVPQTPTLISPANSEQYAGKALKLTWNAVKYAQYYRLMVSKQSDFSSDVIVNEVKLDKPSFDLSGLEVNVNYFWKVQAFSDAGSSNWTPVWGFRAGIPAPETVILNDPPDNATFLGTNVRLKWNIASHSDSYQIQLSKSSDFTSDVAVDVENINATSYDAKNLEENIKFYWRVRGKNEGGFGQWSSVWNFTSNFQAPAIPTLLTPLNNSQGVEINPVLKWNPADRAQSYHIIVSKTSDFSGDIV
ncbi:MAG: fibronectin type III domain-containing protein, partial [Bacteroidota bacterium]